jgi:hypothetical protein
VRIHKLLDHIYIECIFAWSQISGNAPLTGFLKEKAVPRIPESELERLKAEVSLVRLVEASGIVLTRQGKDVAGRCPFHEDATASLIVTEAKNLFHCFGCGAAGGPIDWVMKRQGVSFRHATELLREGLPLAAGSMVGSAAPVKQSTVRHLAAPVATDADDRAVLGQVIAYYHATLKQSPDALAYLAARGLTHPALIDTFQLGYANRTLGLRLPEKNRQAGAEVRGRLQRLGVYRASGHEHFNGSLVVPVVDRSGSVVEVYGRKVLDNLRAGTPKHLYLPGPHAGVWNEAGLAASREVILCEALVCRLSQRHRRLRRGRLHCRSPGRLPAARHRTGADRLRPRCRWRGGRREAGRHPHGRRPRVLPHRVSQGHGRERLRLEGDPGRQVAGSGDPQGGVAGQRSRTAA